jgi:photosystem II stability/assembly factor-like uncharacterized protein
MRRTVVFFVILTASQPLLLGQTQKPSQKPAGQAKPDATPARKSPTAAMLKSFAARSIGPAVMGGRISDIAFDPKDAWTFYVATAHGGLMKTADNGGSFTPLTDKQDFVSTGAVAVAPSDSKVIWLGTGEANDRNSSGWGTGVYRSTDGGTTWAATGLRGTKAIARIVVHPTDPAVAYVAAVGDLWNDSPERGLYKTTDAGQSWTLVLQAPAPDNVVTGCGEVALDPQTPDTVYAVLYARRRTPWSFEAGPDATRGRDVGGIYRSTDAGATWKKLAGGLPAQTGRIGLSVFARNPQVIYAIVQSNEGGTQNIDELVSRRGGVFRTDDGGETWRRTNPLNPRPFYFSQIRVDPGDERFVYVLGFMLHVSEDGGKTFREDRFKKVHPDTHALAIDPRDPRRMLLGTDGGVYQTYDRAVTWAHVNTMAIGEFYRIAVDDSTPYRICGGLQDNLNWVGPSATRTKAGIANADWINIGGGDGFYCVFDPTDPDIVYAESQQGTVHRMNLASGAVKGLRPEPQEGQTGFRFHWNSPLVASPHEKGAMYLAGNRIFKLTDRGESWRPISPDLSARHPERIMTVGSGAENYGVVYTLGVSPRKAGLIWAGTDDGRLWLTEDEGGTWTDRTASLPPAAKDQWIMRVEPGHADEKVAYLVVSAFQTGNYAPLVYRTADLGRTWQNLAGNLPASWPARVVREAPANPDLLFAGTEIGLFASFDRGATWLPFGGLPATPVDDIVVHPRARDLVVATHGRSLYIVDDIGALERLTPEVMAQAAYLFPVAPAFGFEPLPALAEWGGGAGVFRGDNPPPGARFDVWVGEFTGEPLKLSVKAPGGATAATFSTTAMPGFNRLVWDLKPTKDVLNEYGGQGSKFVAPGEYEVTLTFGSITQTQTVQVTIAKGLETR